MPEFTVVVTLKAGVRLKVKAETEKDAKAITGNLLESSINRSAFDYCFVFKHVEDMLDA